MRYLGLGVVVAVAVAIWLSRSPTPRIPDPSGPATAAASLAGADANEVAAGRVGAASVDPAPADLSSQGLPVRLVDPQGRGVRGQVFWREGPRLPPLVRRLTATADWSRRAETDTAGQAVVPCAVDHHVWLAVVCSDPPIVRYRHVAPGRRSTVQVILDATRCSIHVLAWDQDLIAPIPGGDIELHQRSRLEARLERRARVRSDEDGYAVFVEVEHGVHLVALAGAALAIPGPDAVSVVTQRMQGSTDEIVHLCGAAQTARLRLELVEVPDVPSVGAMLVLRSQDRECQPMVLGVAHGRAWQVERVVPCGRYRLEARPAATFEFEGVPALFEVRGDTELRGRVVRSSHTRRFTLRGPPEHRRPFRVCIELADGSGVSPEEDYVGGVNLPDLTVDAALAPGRQRFVVFDRDEVWIGPWMDGAEPMPAELSLAPGCLLEVAVVGPVAAAHAQMVLALVDGSDRRMVAARRQWLPADAGPEPGFRAWLAVGRDRIGFECLGADGSVIGARIVDARGPFARAAVP